ncbi:MAG: type II secretion system F family protein, partial [Deltaproteobacteria bacterium]|nr:type II secretion system F family protein [Deltaproteobacteria bacterium]
LSVLLRSGVPLVEALSALIEQLDHPELKTAFTDTRNQVNEGSTLADALRAHPKIFLTLYVNMVAAGEASGTLEEVLGRLAEFLDDQTRLQSKVRGALAYPVVMAVVVVLILFLMMSVVVPKVTAIFEKLLVAHRGADGRGHLLVPTLEGKRRGPQEVGSVRARGPTPRAPVDHGRRVPVCSDAGHAPCEWCPRADRHGHHAQRAG